MANKIHRTMIGGQAVIEGVMMRGVSRTALAVRRPDGSISLESWPVVSVRSPHSPLRIPIVRGCVNFVEMLIYGYRTLMRSAEISSPEEDAPAAGGPEQAADSEGSYPATDAPAAGGPEQAADSEGSYPATDAPAAGDPGQAAADLRGGFGADGSEIGSVSGVEGGAFAACAAAGAAIPADSDAGKKKGGKDKKDKKEKDEDGGELSTAATFFALFIGFAFAIFLFVVLPTLIVGKTEPFMHWGKFRTLVEGIIKIGLFVGYLAIISRMKDIQRVYQYHGAEHKTIYCYEHGDELTPENAKKYTRFHPRCGTSFLLIVLIVSIILFSFVTWKTLWLRIVLKLLLLPVVVGISYEIIKFAGRHDNSFMRFLLAPGLWLQRLTTREPDESQLEVAIASIKAVLTDNPDDDSW